MASILAPAATTANSSDVVVAAGAVVTIGLYVASGDIPQMASLDVLQKTPGGDVPIWRLDRAGPSQVISGPGTYYVKRVPSAAWAQDVGVYSET